MSMGTLRLADVQKALYNWVVLELSGSIRRDQVIWRNQSEPLPERPCVTLKITDGPRMVGSFDNIKYVGGSTFNMGGQRTMTVSIQIFGNTKIHRPQAYQLAVDLHSSLSKVTVLDRLRGNGVAIQGRQDVSNLTALEESEYEERAQFDVLLGVAQNVADEPGIIENVNIKENIDGKPPVTIPVETP